MRIVGIYPILALAKFASAKSAWKVCFVVRLTFASALRESDLKDSVFGSTEKGEERDKKLRTKTLQG